MITIADKFEVRSATETDLSALAEIKPPIALHRDRLRDADGQDLLYLVVASPVGIAGFGMVVFRWPPAWPEPDGHLFLPTMVDLVVRPELRSHGIGSYLIRRMEDTACERGFTQMHVAVDPVDNPRAHRLYLRLGYRTQQHEPYRSRWKFTDSEGNEYHGEDWQVDMRRSLSNR
jgi:GNAT superfamily N-acetyltransferase